MFIVEKEDETICFIHMYKCAGMSILKSLRNEKLLNEEDSHIHNSLYRYYNYSRTNNISLIRNPLTWYKSLVNYEISRIEDDLGINLFARYFIFEDYPNNNRNMNFDMTIDRMINMKKFFIEQPHQLQHFKDELRENKYSNRMVMNIFNIRSFNDIDNMILEDTYYQEMVKRFGIYDTTYYRMEDDLLKVKEILGIKELVHININKKNNTLSDFQLEEIKIKDKVLFDKFGYDL